MRVINFQAENFQNLKLVDITPEGNIITIRGENEQGKSAVLNAVWTAIEGKAKAPAMLIRKGEEECRLRIVLGHGEVAELIATRRFTIKEGGQITDALKVESADGKQRYQKPQAVLDDLIGQMGFDPFEFVKMKPEAQAATLLEMVPLPIDLEEMARFDESDFQNRRDVNREIESLDAQIAAIPERDDLPEDAPDRQALLAELAGAADANGAIERERVRRQERAAAALRAREGAEQQESSAGEMRAQAARLISQAEDLEGLAAGQRDRAAEIDKEIDALPALDEAVDTAKLREQLVEADQVAEAMAAQARRTTLIRSRAEKAAKSEAYTTAMDGRKKERRDALAGAKMPIEGLGFGTNDKGKAVVTFGGVPFEQASTAAQIKASTAIAMAANPELRVLRIKDGSLLDKKSMAILEEMAAADDFQLWVEVVGSEGVGIIMEDGAVKGAPVAEPQPAKKAKAKPAADEEKGPLL